MFARRIRHSLAVIRGRIGLVRLCALLGFLIAGCETQAPILRRPDPPPPPGCPAPAASSQPVIGYNPPPRTAFQAFRAYIFCLRHPECPECFPPPPKEEEKKKDENGDKNGKEPEKKNDDNRPPDLKILPFCLDDKPEKKKDEKNNKEPEKKEDEQKSEPEENKEEKPEEYKPQWLNAHTQTTLVPQRH
ncbi:MAG TPA: hypothetical protein VGZ47_15060, partial [Gemmataceae bacterium]|nr:hypothetical protein [Gemmataceae bacterium]